jgi:hypothetical protein
MLVPPLLLLAVVAAGLLIWQRVPRRPPPPEWRALTRAGAVVGGLAMLALVVSLFAVLFWLVRFSRTF